MEFSLSHTVLGFVGTIKMSKMKKTIREPSRELYSVGNPDRSPDITQAEEVSTHIKCTRSAEREWLNTKA